MKLITVAPTELQTLGLRTVIRRQAAAVYIKGPGRCEFGVDDYVTNETSPASSQFAACSARQITSHLPSRPHPAGLRRHRAGRLDALCPLMFWKVQASCPR